jgi:hypothetical protein
MEHIGIQVKFCIIPWDILIHEHMVNPIIEQLK